MVSSGRRERDLRPLRPNRVPLAGTQGMCRGRCGRAGQVSWLAPHALHPVEPRFQGGAIGEVSGAKAVAALEHAADDARGGVDISAVLIMESGGVRLQEANLGLTAVAEICAALLDLRRYDP